MRKSLNVWWRWLRIKRVKMQRYYETAAGDNFPVLARVPVRTE